jgi:hypothetical protein
MNQENQQLKNQLEILFKENEKRKEEIQNQKKTNLLFYSKKLKIIKKKFKSKKFN